MNVKRLLGLGAMAGLLALAAPTGRAEAASLIQPGIAVTIQHDAASTTEVHWRRHHRAHRHHHVRRHYGHPHRWHRGPGHRHHAYRHHAYPRHWR